MTCPDCHRLENDLRLTREALELAESALAASQAKVEQLRGQIQRLQQRSGMAPAWRMAEIAAHVGVGYTTVVQWAQRYPDWPRKVQDDPPLYDRAEVEEFLRRHPRLGKAKGAG